MSTHEAGTAEAFTVVLCTGGTGGGAAADELRAAVRRCPHGVLVVSPCLLGRFTCASHCAEAGAVAVLQPCERDRAASGPALWVGPVRGRLDARMVHDWLVQGAWRVAALPSHLQSSLNLRHAISRLN